LSNTQANLEQKFNNIKREKEDLETRLTVAKDHEKSMKVEYMQKIQQLKSEMMQKVEEDEKQQVEIQK
jgi:hypothetical protein